MLVAKGDMAMTKDDNSGQESSLAVKVKLTVAILAGLVLMVVVFILLQTLKSTQEPSRGALAIQAVLGALWYTTVGVLAAALVSFMVVALNNLKIGAPKYRFRWEYWFTQEDWAVFALGIFGSVGVTVAVLLKDVEIPLDLGYGDILAYPVIVILAACLAAVLVTNLLRWLQFVGFTVRNLRPPSCLADGSVELSVESVRGTLQEVVKDGVSTKIGDIQDQLRGIEILVARDEQGSQELAWSEKYIERLENPNLSKPADILSIDSQTSLRAIYPAALLFWSEQVRLKLRSAQVEWMINNQDVVGAGNRWRRALAEFMRDSIDRANQNFGRINAESGDAIANRVLVQDMIDGIRPDRSISVRLLIYEYGVLGNEVVRAVIEFHEAVGIPLFFLPAPFCRRLRSYGGGGGGAERGEMGKIWSRVNELGQLYRQVQQVMANSSQEKRWSGTRHLTIEDLSSGLWSGSDDDFIIVDDVAWKGYPGPYGRPQLPEEIDPLPYIQKFCFLLSCPGILLAAHARALATRERVGAGIAGANLLAHWYEDLANSL